MDATPLQQIVNLIKNKDNILLVGHRKPDGDALGSLLGLYLTLESIGKKVKIASSDIVPELYHFLPNLDKIDTEFSNTQDFIITLDCKNSEVDKLKYNLDDNKVNIIVSPLYGSFSEKDVVFSKGSNQFDLIIVLDSADLEQVGNIYEKNADLFFSAPVINIDHHASNTFFGNINLVDITAASTSEVIVPLIKEIEKVENKKLMTPDIATLILLGIITDTNSFQNPNTTPKSFDTAADLIDAGARQQEIIQNIYKTKKVSTLKLWGNTLSKIQVDPIHRLVWSTINKNDLHEMGASPDEASGIIDELMSNAPGAEVILLLKDTLNGMLSGSVRTTSPNIDANQIAGLFGGGGHLQAAGFKIKNGKDFDIHLADVLNKICAFQAERLNLPDNTTKGKKLEVGHEVQLPHKEVSLPAEVEQKKELQTEGKKVEEKRVLNFKPPQGQYSRKDERKSINIGQKLSQKMRPEMPQQQLSQKKEEPNSEVNNEEKQQSERIRIPKENNQG